jgi:CRP/FNR family cyclic AMP-dependent transcriptional regulator
MALTMNATVQELRSIPFFADFSDESLTLVAKAAIRRAYAPGETIILAGEPCQAAYFIVAGQVRVYRLSLAGREQVLARLGPGKSFNSVPLFQARRVNHATVQALTPVTLYAVPADELHRLVLQRPDLALALLQDFAARLDHLTDLVEDLALRTVQARLARFLLEHIAADQPPQRWTQEEIATYLGTVRDMIGRALRAFADEGLLRIERQRIVLLDRQGLEDQV